MFNLVVISGRVCNDIELKYTQSNIPVCSFTIACDRRGKGEDKQTDFINIVAWRQTAEFISKYFAKGSMIGIEGSIQTRKFTDKDGNNRTAFEVIVNNVQFMDSKKNESDGEKSPSENLERLKENLASLEGVDLPFN